MIVEKFIIVKSYYLTLIKIDTMELLEMIVLLDFRYFVRSVLDISYWYYSEVYKKSYCMYTLLYYSYGLDKKNKYSLYLFMKFTVYQ
jgi:hypothetical protein